MLLASASLGGKIYAHGLADWESAQQADRKLAAFLEGEGWSLQGNDELMPDQRKLIFAAPDCARAIEAVRVSPVGEMFAVLAAMRGEDYRLVFIEEGAIKERPSPVGYVEARIRSVAAQLGIPTSPRWDLTAIFEPTECDAVSRVAWLQLVQTPPGAASARRLEG